MQTKSIALLIFFLLAFCLGIAQKSELIWQQQIEAYHFVWDLETDKARAVQTSSGREIWNGSLLPAFEIQHEGINQYIKAEVDLESTRLAIEEGTIHLRFGDLAKGQLMVSREQWGVSFDALELQWIINAPNIVALYFGTSEVQSESKGFLKADELPFRADWSASGYCVPGAKEGTVQSYFRMWDFGQTSIALGSFGPSMATLYGAAYPRPVLGFAMGNEDGWVSFGVGTVPDAAMLLKLQYTHGAIQYVYREDLWGAGSKERVWEKPLQITFGGNAWLALKYYMDSFPQKSTSSEVHSKSLWNTWGNWRKGDYSIRSMVDFARQVGVERFVADDPWEESQGIGKPSYERFPDFKADLSYIDNRGLDLGVWETLGWISDTTKAGLTSEDLIINKDGIPCKSSWSFDAFSDGYYCLDISSERSREFLRERTLWTMRNVKPKLIKLDFGYGLPSPHMGVPRNPSYRGEKYCFELLKIIAETAKSVDPDVTIMYYGINPQFLPYVDMISLDDQGDMWYDIKGGHDQWSLWASLLSQHNVAISGSSSYNWHTDDAVVINSFILGVPGAVLGTNLENGRPVPKKYLNRRLAINTWYRKGVSWQPLWLNSEIGGLARSPEINCWGREEILDDQKVLTTLILQGEKESEFEELLPYEWSGRWALISQTDERIEDSKKLAMVPFDKGSISIKLNQKPLAVSKLSLEGMIPYSNWSWKKGKITIEVDENSLNETAGFLIERG